MTNRNLILHPLFVISLLTLLVNDFYCKEAFPNLLTGKLSDFAGLIVFPVFIASLFPSSKTWISIVTGVLFIVWKTPFVSPVLQVVNQAFPFRIQRVIDYSDNWALLVLPLTHSIISQNFQITFINNSILQLSKMGLTLTSVFAICATSYIGPPEMPKGTIYIGKEYTINKSKEETIQAIKSLGYPVDYHDHSTDSTKGKNDRIKEASYYQTDNIIIYDDRSQPVDTILNIKYYITEPKKNRTSVQIINVTLSEDGNIQKWQTLKFLSKQYNTMLEKQIIKKIK